MATVRYFNEAERVSYLKPVDNADFAAMFPGVRGVRYDSFARIVGKSAAGAVCPITRQVFFKANPSLHKCDARCLNAKGHNCECSCGGSNHGRGAH